MSNLGLLLYSVGSLRVVRHDKYSVRGALGIAPGNVEIGGAALLALSR